MVIRMLMSAEDILQVKESDVPDLGRGQLESIRCQASEAHALIIDVTKEKKKHSP